MAYSLVAFTHSWHILLKQKYGGDKDIYIWNKIEANSPASEAEASAASCHIVNIHAKHITNTVSEAFNTLHMNCKTIVHIFILVQSHKLHTDIHNEQLSIRNSASLFSSQPVGSKCHTAMQTLYWQCKRHKQATSSTPLTMFTSRFWYHLGLSHEKQEGEHPGL